MSPRDPGDYRLGQRGAHPSVPAHVAAELHAATGADWPVSGDQLALERATPAGMHGYRVRYCSPTDTRGARWSVTSLQTGRRVMVDYHAVSGMAAERGSDNHPRMAAEIVNRGPVAYIGEDARGSYYAGQ